MGPVTFDLRITDPGAPQKVKTLALARQAQDEIEQVIQEAIKAGEADQSGKRLSLREAVEIAGRT